MSVVKTLYSASNQTITCTLAALASSATAGRASTAVDNTTNLYLDALVFLNITNGAGTPANDQAIYVYAYGTADGGTTYTNAITGTDAAFTDSNPSLLRLIGVIPVSVTGQVCKAGPFSVAQAFGGWLPDHWGIFVRNYEGFALSSGSAFWQGVQQSVI